MKDWVLAFLRRGSGSLIPGAVWCLSKLHRGNIFSLWVSTAECLDQTWEQSYQKSSSVILYYSIWSINVDQKVPSFNLLNAAWSATCFFLPDTWPVFQSALTVYFINVLCRWEAGSPLHNEGPGRPPDDAPPAGVFLRWRQTKDNGTGQQKGTALFKR